MALWQSYRCVDSRHRPGVTPIFRRKDSAKCDWLAMQRRRSVTYACGDTPKLDLKDREK